MRVVAAEDSVGSQQVEGERAQRDNRGHVPEEDREAYEQGLRSGVVVRESQGFRLSVIRRAYELAGADPGFAAAPPTDDCGVVLRYLPDVPIRAVPGSERNLKITYPADLAIAEVLLRYGR